MACGYRPRMSDKSQERPVRADGVPSEEGLDVADVAERLDEDPDEQENYTEEHGLDESQQEGH